MSIFVNIANAAHSFAAWVEKEWTVVYKAEPKIEQILAAVLKYAGPALQMVVTAEAGGPAGAEVGKILADAQAGLLAASSLVCDFGASPTITGVLSSVQSSLGALLAAAKVTNPNSVAIVTRVVNELATLIAALPTA